MNKNPYKGKICFNTNQKLLSFDVTKQTNFHFTDTLLCEFNNLHLSSEEKIKLTHKDRETIKKYQSVNSSIIMELSNKLIKQVSKQKHKQLTINASDFGVYICLAAIFSGKLPKDVNISFCLENTPVSIFPRQLVKKVPSNNLKVEFKVDQECWLSPFKSLYNSFPGLSAKNLLKAA